MKKLFIVLLLSLVISVFGENQRNLGTVDYRDGTINIIVNEGGYSKWFFDSDLLKYEIGIPLKNIPYVLSLYKTALDLTEYSLSNQNFDYHGTVGSYNLVYSKVSMTVVYIFDNNISLIRTTLTESQTGNVIVRFTTTPEQLQMFVEINAKAKPEQDNMLSIRKGYVDIIYDAREGR